MMLTTLGKNTRGAASTLLYLITRAFILHQSAYSCPLAPTCPQTEARFYLVRANERFIDTSEFPL